MNKLKFLIVPLILGLGLLSCSDSDKEEDPVPADGGPVLTQLQLVDVTLKANYQVIDTESKAVTIDVKHSVADATTLVYAIHRKFDGEMVTVKSISHDRLKEEVENGVFSFGTKLLPDAEYYVSVVAVIGEGNNAAPNIYMEYLEKNYKDAIVQMADAYTYYNTMEIKVDANNKSAKTPAMELKKMTTDLVIEFADANKLPKDKDKYKLFVEVKHLPSAFYLATGITLTTKEVVEKGAFKFQSSKHFALPGKTKEPLVIQFHTLRNDNLDDNKSERGELSYTFVEVRNNTYPLELIAGIKVGKYDAGVQFHLSTQNLLSPKHPRGGIEAVVE